ncbi:MAG: aerobic carbon-monoxide dehydrogenase small subunit [Blastocatellia bacterium]
MPIKKKQKAHVRFSLNREVIEVAFAPHKTLLEVLREDLALTGTKHGCELGECGVCTVLVDGQPVLSCLMLGLDAEGREVTSIEGMAEGNEIHPLQETFADLGAAQCGYCTPGFLLTAKELLEQNPSPSRAEIQESLSGILCRCTGYIKIYEAVELAAARLRGEQVEPARESLYGYE